MVALKGDSPFFLSLFTGLVVWLVANMHIYKLTETETIKFLPWLIKLTTSVALVTMRARKTTGNTFHSGATRHRYVSRILRNTKACWKLSHCTYV
jgi:hypothetical protein